MPQTPQQHHRHRHQQQIIRGILILCIWMMESVPSIHETTTTAALFTRNAEEAVEGGGGEREFNFAATASLNRLCAKYSRKSFSRLAEDGEHCALVDGADDS